VWRDFANDGNPVEVHVQKIRFRQIGRIGMAKLQYQKATQTYKELTFHDGRNESGSASQRYPTKGKD
jgi:hypothetical protein